ncbi:hypothetical protein GOODEAATRI_006499 [Goodea atripinnis]|uniref:NADH dehydrogenase subunit 5 n=1 Tax=Goodea atripinnis TaxID=208336 RepID=A0ABV0PBV3_9TELE
MFSRLDRLSRSINLSSNLACSFSIAVMTSSMFRILPSAFSIRPSTSSILVFTFAISSFIVSNCSLFSWRNPFSYRKISSVLVIFRRCSSWLVSFNPLAANCCCFSSLSLI